MIKKLIFLAVLVLVAAGAGFGWWARRPITTAGPAIDFTVTPGSSIGAAAQQIAHAGVPVNPFLLSMLARATHQAARIKAGSYEVEPFTTPMRLLDKMVKGEFAQGQLTVIEGWTFKQMRAAIDAAPALRHDTHDLSDQALLQKVAPEFKAPEGLFFPDTYLYPKGSSDLDIYKQAHTAMMNRLDAAWAKREPNLPYGSPYDALILASIVEKETGQKSERGMVAAVFVNRLKLGMMLQTDPTVIYGLGAKYDGKIHKKDLETDTPYNTYTRTGLPPTPISLPGVQSLAAALAPAKTDALYFVSRGDGTSVFSGNLNDHNKAVNQYQRQ